jgi:hypothetical protein
MVASNQMNFRSLRGRRSWAHRAAVGRLVLALLAGASAFPQTASANPEVVAVRGVPSSLSDEFGPVVPIGALGSGVIAAPSGGGVEFYGLAQPGTPVLGRFRTAGPVTRIARAGSTLFLIAGSRGVVAIDATDAATPVAVGSYGGLGRIKLGAAAPTGGGVLAAFDSTLHFLTFGASGFDLRRTVRFGGNRTIAAIASQGDSFLVASNRSGVPNRVVLTLYRMPAGATVPDSLGEFALGGHTVSDLAWIGPRAFLADGNNGILIVNVPARAAVRTVPVLGTRLVRSLDVNDSAVVAVTEGRTFARYRRVGAAGDSLSGETSRVLTNDPAHVRLSGDLAVASTYDVIAPTPPDESGVSLLEFVSLSGALEPAPVGGTGRVRRVAAANGFAYIADYTGGFRAYHVGDADTSLVGQTLGGLNSRAVDIALDPTLPLAYLASGAAGLEVVKITDPSAPVLVSSIPLPGLASAVTVVAPNLIAVARRGITNAGVTFFEVSYDSLLGTATTIARGSIDNPTVIDPRALAARDTVLFVADDVLGVRSIGFGNPDVPSSPGGSSGAAARDIDLSGGQMLVATSARGLQIVDVTNPAFPVLRGEFPTPPLLGVTRSGSSAVLFTGEDGAIVVDIANPAAPFARGPIPVPGTARDGVWVGDTLLVAASLSLERFQVSPTPVAVPALDVRLDPASALPRALISWAPITLPGVTGLNLYRDLGTGAGTTTPPPGRRVNQDLLPPGATSTVDDSLTAGADHRYRLEAFFADGSSVKVAEGALSVSAAAKVGRVYPNPFRPKNGAASISYQVGPSGSAQEITLRVYDVAGRLVRESSSSAPAGGGFGVVSWDGKDARGRLATDGIYFLRVTGAGLEDSRAVTLLR